MTHMSPTALLFCCTCTGAGFLYFTWHSWCFDRFRSLLPTRRQAFKCGITWLMLIAYALFGVWSVGMAYIKYAVGYTNVPTHGSVPTPYRLWPEKYQNVAPLLYYLLVGGFALILSIHIEETCFWIHLARSIQGKTEKTWLGSSWFKLWLGSSLVGAMTLFAVAIPFNDDPQQMETNDLFGGTVFSVIFTIFSFYVILRFPRLIETVRSQGGSQVVLTRLAYHRRLTKYRVFARIIFAVPFLIISVDGLEPHHDVAEHQFLTDLFLFTGLVGLFGSTIISIFIFFPPSDPSIASFAAGDSKRLLTIDQVRTHYDPSPSLPVLANRPDHSRLQPSHMLKHEEATQNGMETGHAQYFMANDSFAKEQIRTQMSMVAPFATPPATPRQSRGLDALGRTGTPPVKDSTRVSRSNTDTSKNSHLAHPETGGTQGGSAYAWGLLADHLKIPETSLGMMREMTEMNKKGWKAARRTAENELFPGVGAHNARSRESSFTRTKRDQEILDSSKMEKEPARPDSFQVLESPPPSAPRSLPPPLRSPPRIHRNFLASDRAELDMPYSATRSSDDILRALQSVRQ